MSYQKPPIIDEDETAVLLVTTILSPTTTTTMDHRSKRMMAVAIVAGIMMLVAGGAFLMQDESFSYDHAAGSLNTAAEEVGRTTTVTVRNNTPYDVRPLSRQNESLEYTRVGYDGCTSDYFDDPGIKAGKEWTSSSRRGLCLVTKIVAVLTLPDSRGVLQCTNYESSADSVFTANSIYYIRMGGGDGCCVRSSSQNGECGPEQTYVHNPNYNYDGTVEENETIDGWFQGRIPCLPAVGTFNGISAMTGSSYGYWVPNGNSFETCYQYGGTDKYCWSRSYYARLGYPYYDGSGWYECVPDGGASGGWYALNSYYPKHANYNVMSCGPACQNVTTLLNHQK